MRRARIAAFAGSAALTIGVGMAAASDPATQTVSISVTAAPLTVSVDGDVTFLVQASGDAMAPAYEEDTTITFSNPAGSGVPTAKVTVRRAAGSDGLSDATSGRALRLQLNIQDPGGQFIDATEQSPPTWSEDSAAEFDLATGISSGTSVPARALIWTLDGTTGTVGTSVESTFTFTIAEQDAPDPD
jgi:hypothetical protein